MPMTRMRRLLLAFALSAAVFMPHPAKSQYAENIPPNSRAGAEAGALTPSQAQQALEVLQNDAKRTQLIETLRAIAAASRGVPAPAPDALQQSSPPPASNSLGGELLAQASDWVGEVSRELATAAQAVTDFPLLWRWLVQTASDPLARGTLLSIAWKLLLVIGCALAVEWVVLRAVRRPLALVERYVPVRDQDRRRHHGARTGTSDLAGDAATDLAARQHGDPGLRKRSVSFARAWQFLQRLPFVLAGLALNLLPVLAFTVVGNMLLATQLGSEAVPRVVILAMVNAYVLCRVIMTVTRMLVSPNGSNLGLLSVRGETGAYIVIWVRRVVTVAVFGIALANVALVLGLYRPAYDALVKLVVLTVHLFGVIVILQCRRPVADLIRAPEGSHGVLAMVRNRVADVWHYVAIFLNLALWAVWALKVENGYALLLQYVLTTAVVLVVARLISVVVLGALDRVFRINPEFIRRFPGLEDRANNYYPLLRGLVSGLVALITVLALLQVWGVHAVEWFYDSRVGGRLMFALLTIGIVALVALAVWETSNGAMERHLARLTRDARYARAARLRTFLPMLRTTLLCIILTIVGLTVLSSVGVNIAPLLAGAGIVGIAIGFGSQKLVQDLITGLFLLLENAMQVGDMVTVSGLTGRVENLSIRTIRLRAGDGSVHIIPFSAVTSVTNTNRGIGNASISVNVAYHEDTDLVGDVLKEIAAEMRDDPDYRHLIRGDLELWGVDKMDASMVTIVGQIQCTDHGRWPVQREFYRRMKRRFQEQGIHIAPASHATLLVQQYPSAPLEIEAPERKAG
ncbi:MAG: mechanosensitive ion channel domain-containing protein [Methyloceanibacter sp.]